MLDAGPKNEKLERKMCNTIIAYDMCLVDGLKLAKCDLPIQKPFDKMWQTVAKVIDRLHIRNHKDAMCKSVYNLDGKIPALYNTMAAEQTNVRASRLKRIMCYATHSPVFLPASFHQEAKCLYTTLPFK